jgi:hypothetical protein
LNDVISDDLPFWWSWLQCLNVNFHLAKRM